MFGINYAFISSNRRKHTVKCTTVYMYILDETTEQTQPVIPRGFCIVAFFKSCNEVMSL